MLISAAGLITELQVNYELLLSRVKPYIYTGDKNADITIEISKQFFIDRQAENPHLTPGECEYLWTASFFYEQLARFDGLMLHASCVEYEGKAYLFSATSGTGKSTHTHLWLKYLPGSRIVNDDKPAIRLIDGKFYAFGTPWSGKTDESINEGVPIAGIAFLSRGKNEIHRASGIPILKKFMDQTVRPSQKELMCKMLETLDKLFGDVPVFELSCDMSKEAVQTSYQAMRL